MKILTVVSNALGNNTYIVVSEKGNAVVIDPSTDYFKIQKAIEEANAEVKYVLLTHGHFDHTASVSLVKEKYGAKVVINQKDAEMLGNPKKSLSFMFEKNPAPVTPDITVTDGDKLNLDELEFEFMTTPGHTMGSTVIFCGDILFTGDMILEGTVGRMDFAGGSEEMMIESVKRLAKIEKNYTLLCGHGEPSTLDKEKQQNPYFIRYA